jgi:hypothetical protein
VAGPLRGMRVLDLSRVLAGPWCTQIFADLGAEVIKIERPGKGDDTRHWGPPWLSDASGADTRESSYFLAANRGKHSVTVDLAKQEGLDIVRALAGKSDVVVENFKTGDLARKGLGYEDLSELNPGLVYCSITGFGQTGPMAHLPGYDYLIQAQGGLMSLTGNPGWRTGRRAAAGGACRLGSHNGHERRHRDPRGAPSSGPHRQRPAHRSFSARCPGQLAGKPGAELLLQRGSARTYWRISLESGALPAISYQRWQSDYCGRQR